MLGFQICRPPHLPASTGSGVGRAGPSRAQIAGRLLRSIIGGHVREVAQKWSSAAHKASVSGA